MSWITIPILCMKTPCTALQILLRRPIHIPSIPQMPPWHVALFTMCVIQEILLGKPRIESTLQPQQRLIILKQLLTRGKHEKPAAQIIALRAIRREGVIVLPVIRMRRETVRPGQGGFVRFGLLGLVQHGLQRGRLVVEDAVQPLGHQHVGVEEADLGVAGQLEQAQLGEHVAPPVRARVHPRRVELGHGHDGRALARERRAFPAGYVVRDEHEEGDAAVAPCACRVQQLVGEHAGTEEVAIVVVVAVLLFQGRMLVRRPAGEEGRKCDFGFMGLGRCGELCLGG